MITDAPAVKRAGRSEITYHGLRHSFVAICGAARRGGPVSPVRPLGRPSPGGASVVTEATCLTDRGFRGWA